MMKHFLSILYLTVFTLSSLCYAAFEGVQPASTCWDPKWKKSIDLSEFIPNSVSTALSGGSNYEGANGAAGNIGNSNIRSKLGFISNAKDLAQASTCIAGLLDTITGRNDGSFTIKVKNESGYLLSFYGQGGLWLVGPGQYAKYTVYNKYGAFFFKWNGRCYGTRFQKGSSRITDDNIYIDNNKIKVYQSNNRRWDAGCKWFSISESFCNGPYNNDKELAFVKEYINNGYTERCRSAGVY